MKDYYQVYSIRKDVYRITSVEHVFMDLLHRHNTESARAEWVLLAEHTRNWETGEVFNGLPEGFNREAYIAGGPNRFRSLSERMVFDLGGKTIRVLETPGHTKKA